MEAVSAKSRTGHQALPYNEAESRAASADPQAMLKGGFCFHETKEQLNKRLEVVHAGGGSSRFRVEGWAWRFGSLSFRCLRQERGSEFDKPFP